MLRYKINVINERIAKVRAVKELQGTAGQADDEIDFHFNPITPEDWRANEAPLADLYQRGVISAEYVRDRLNIPEEAGQGTMAPQPMEQPKPLGDVKGTVPGGNERWLLKESRKGIIAEKIE